MGVMVVVLVGGVGGWEGWKTLTRHARRSLVLTQELSGVVMRMRGGGGGAGRGGGHDNHVVAQHVTAVTRHAQVEWHGDL